MTTKSSKRIWELDAIRGLAIILMVIFHLVFDLSAFYGASIDYAQGFWYYEGRSSALLFILVSGVSATLGQNTSRRGIMTFAWGMLLTVATYLVAPSLYIRFGILHFLGVAMVLASFVRRWPPMWLLATAIVSVVLGWKLHTIQTDWKILFPFGLASTDFQSLDYYPVFPYLGVYLLGIMAGQLLYREPRSLFASRPTVVSGLEWLGRRSLTIYLVHQPALLALLYVAHRVGLV